MRQTTMEITFGCLLHDVGKLCFRAGESGTHSDSGYMFMKKVWENKDIGRLLDCLRWHHAAELRRALPEADNPAYIACVADNIAAAADRRVTEEEGSFDRYMPLSPVFSHLNGEHAGFALPAHSQDGTLRMPLCGEVRLSQGEYAEICRRFEKQLQDIPAGEEWVDSLLTVLEELTSTVPSSTNTGESPDISFYDHVKISAAVGACIAEYCAAAGVTDYRTKIWEREREFRAEKTFLLYSADFSGIQRFIFSASTTGALRSFRSRSFFLELAMEHYIDELLALCGVSRANLLYAGGGHCYLLLPNTTDVKKKADAWNTRFNDWLLQSFGLGLYLADGWSECSANDLTNTPAEASPYQAMFRRVSRAVAKKKLHRYTAQQIIEYNRREEDLSGRECRVCGRTDRLITSADGSLLCPWCDAFERLSRKIQRSDVYLVLRGSAADADFTLPCPEGEASFFFVDEEKASSALKEERPVLRIYTKNKTCADLRYSTRLYVSDYAASNETAALAQETAGIHRLGVCRMDVDDLGQSFVAGFENEKGTTTAERRHFVTLSRTAAFSRQMSLFFKLYLNALLDGSYKNRKALAVTVVYSGGDDVFLVGAWNDALEAARRIRCALEEYSCGSLTISGGVGLFDEHYPIRLAAEETAEMENEAKRLPRKNAVALFAPNSGNVYGWAAFEEEVLGGKLAELERFFKEGKTERGTAFLYNILALLRETQDDARHKLPLARLAYLLARLAPKNDPSYRAFSQRMIAWATQEKDRAELITALYLFVYKNREEANA